MKFHALIASPRCFLMAVLVLVSPIPVLASESLTAKVMVQMFNHGEFKDDCVVMELTASQASRIRRLYISSEVMDYSFSVQIVPVDYKLPRFATGKTHSHYKVCMRD